MQSSGLTARRSVADDVGAPHSISVYPYPANPMSNQRMRADVVGRDPRRLRCADGLRGAASAMRVLALAAAILCTSACGGGGGGSDTPVVKPPVQKADLAWDNGNWDQQEWQ